MRVPQVTIAFNTKSCVSWMILGYPPWLRKPPYMWIYQTLTGELVEPGSSSLKEPITHSIHWLSKFFWTNKRYQSIFFLEFRAWLTMPIVRTAIVSRRSYCIGFSLLTLQDGKINTEMWNVKLAKNRLIFHAATHDLVIFSTTVLSLYY